MPWLVELLASRAEAAGHTLDGTTVIGRALSAAARDAAMTASKPASTASRGLFPGAVGAGADFAPIRDKRHRTTKPRVTFLAWDAFNRQLLESGASLTRRVRVLVCPRRLGHLTGITPSRLWVVSA